MIFYARSTRSRRPTGRQKRPAPPVRPSEGGGVPRPFSGSATAARSQGEMEQKEKKRIGFGEISESPKDPAPESGRPAPWKSGPEKDRQIGQQDGRDQEVRRDHGEGHIQTDRQAGQQQQERQRFAEIEFGGKAPDGQSMGKPASKMTIRAAATGSMRKARRGTISQEMSGPQ